MKEILERRVISKNLARLSNGNIMRATNLILKFTVATLKKMGEIPFANVFYLIQYIYSVISACSRYKNY